MASHVTGTVDPIYVLLAEVREMRAMMAAVMGALVTGGAFPGGLGGGSAGGGTGGGGSVVVHFCSHDISGTLSIRRTGM